MVQARAGAFGALPSAYDEILERSIASNDELERSAETLLLVSRYESGEASSRRECVVLASVVLDVERELAPLSEHKGVEVTLDLDATLAVDGDDRELRRALVNLLANAIAWTPSARAIAITLREHEGRADVRFDDEGYGVPHADVATLFERVRATPARRGACSGLGLYLVRRIAEAHAGSVRYVSRAEGGSTFTLTLPLAAQAVLR